MIQNMFLHKMAVKRAREKRRDTLIRRVVVGVFLILGLVSLGVSGAADEEQAAASTAAVQRVIKADVYSVKQGDTLESIAKAYILRNTYGRREIREFEEGIKQNNPWLLKTGGELEAGDELIITYFVRPEDSDE